MPAAKTAKTTKKVIKKTSDLKTLIKSKNKAKVKK
jgi:hypothetical protein